MTQHRKMTATAITPYTAPMPGPCKIISLSGLTNHLRQYCEQMVEMMKRNESVKLMFMLIVRGLDDCWRRKSLSEEVSCCLNETLWTDMFLVLIESPPGPVFWDVSLTWRSYSLRCSVRFPPMLLRTLDIFFFILLVSLTRDESPERYLLHVLVGLGATIEESSTVLVSSAVVPAVLERFKEMLVGLGVVF